MAVWSEILLSEVEHYRTDAEFYQPKYLEASKIAGDKKLKQYGISVIHPSEVKRVYSSDGLQIMLAQNNRDNTFDWAVERYMPVQMSKTLVNNKLSFGDVTVTRSGANFGQTSVITIETENKDIYACADLLIIKTTQISGPLLSTYFNSRVGKLLMNRGVYGAGQPHVAPNYIKEIQFPEYLLKYSPEIDNLILTARKKSTLSKLLFIQSQKLLEKELGLSQLVIEKSICYEISFSEAVSNHRVDAQCYKPEYINYEKYLRKKNNFNILREVVNDFVKGKQKNTNSLGEIDYVSIKDIQDFEIFSDKKCFITSDTAIVENETLLLAITGATIGKIGIVSRSKKIAFSGDLLAFKANQNINTYYLLAVMLSPVGQSQCQRWITGSTNGHLSPIDIAKFVIPRMNPKSEELIANYLIDSLKAKKESELLLKQAKNRVEGLIEGVLE